MNIELIKSVVVEAGKIALGHWGAIDAERKSDQSLVTVIDRQNEQLIESRLSAEFPDFAFIGEEFGARGDLSRPTWSCDPIDGTTNFVCGLPQWCVSVGLLQDGVSIMGAVYAPVTDELYWAVRGQGAFLNGKPIRNTDRDSLGVEDTLCLTSNAAKTLDITRLPGRIRCFGSIAMELCYTASGSLCATVGIKEGIVDIGAALCICHEAGCQFEYLAGGEVDIAALIEKRHTDRHFTYAPPRLTEYLRTVLAPAG